MSYNSHIEKIFFLVKQILRKYSKVKDEELKTRIINEHKERFGKIGKRPFTFFYEYIRNDDHNRLYESFMELVCDYGRELYLCDYELFANELKSIYDTHEKYIH